jgi:hypothetical protein
MRLMNLSNVTPRVKMRQSDLNLMCQDLSVSEDTILEIFDYLSTREIVDIVVKK